MALSSAPRDTESPQSQPRVGTSFLLDAEHRAFVERLAADRHCSVGAVLRSIVADAYTDDNATQVAA
jgi:hypothetical protein